jgi:hypothetical protein
MKPPEGVTVNTTSLLIMANNEFRTGLFIRNISTSKEIHLAFGHPAEIGKGLTLYPRESFSMSASDYSVEAVYAIASGDGVEVAVQEFCLLPGE